MSVRECLDVLAIDRLLARGLLTEAQHAAGLMVAAAWRAAGLDRRVTARPGGAAGGADDPPGWPAWRDLVERVPVRYQAVVVSVCGAGQMPTSPLALAALRAGLDALASRRC